MIYKITETEYYNQLEVLPPIYLNNGIFQVSEASSHENGLPTYATYKKQGDNYFELGIMTTKEAKAFENIEVEAEAESQEYEAEQEYEDLSDFEKVKVHCLINSYNYSISEAMSENWEDVSIIEARDIKELGEYIVDNGLIGEIPEALVNYIDYEAIGRDWEISGYSEFEFDNCTYFGLVD